LSILLNTISDYQDGVDSFLLANGLQFNDLTISQDGERTTIANANEVLASLINVPTNAIGSEDFSSV
jgi:hypothetical protein